ncbi:MAG: type II toxin-antitoxin system RelE/ParE family toxin [Cytophagales bacterium]
MAYEIIYSENFVSDLKLVLDYLNYNWSEKVALNFLDQIEKSLNQITNMPESGIKTKTINIFRVLVTKHNSLFYRISNNRIELLNLFDTRQNPLKSPF